jgi:hypothetical protein
MTSPRRRMTPEELAASEERANQKRKFRRLWKGDSSHGEICEEMGMTEEQVAAFAASLGLGEREEPDVYIPSPEDIRMACARIRAGWSQVEREARLEAARSARMDIATGHDTDACRGPTHRRGQGGEARPQAR